MNLLAFVAILSVMMVLHELGHFITARIAGITVQEFGIGLPPRIFGIRRGGVIYSLNWIPFGAFVKMLGEEDPSSPGSFASKPARTRAIVLAAGSGMNFLLAVVAFAVAFMVGVPTPTTEGPVRLVGVAAESPAAAAGLREGDVVVRFNGQPVDDLATFRDWTQQNLGREIQLAVQRSGEEFTTEVTPRMEPPPGQGSLGVVLGLHTRIQQYPVHVALRNGFEQSLRAVGLTLSIPKLLVEGAISPEEARPIGLPGMAQITSQAVDEVVDTGLWFPLLWLTGMFSAGLAVANMLPIPALDGGRLFFVGLEAVRGRRVPPEREAAIHFVGIVVLLTLMLVISVNDLVTPLPQVDWGTR